MSREHFSYDVTCPRCGRVGKVEASENDYPFMRRVAHRIDFLTEGFEVTKHDDTGIRTEISCATCKVVAK
jgi:endogenous inhibitor of DNA gyrase (YacG/DUF329 family)